MRLLTVQGNSERRGDSELLGDRADPSESFGEFYERHAEAVLRYVASRGVDVDSAADIVSETFIAALRQRYRYQPRHDSARLWLLGIATRRIHDVRRRDALAIRKHRLLHSSSLPLTAEDQASYADLQRAETDPLVAGLSDLPTDLRDALVHRVINERAYSDIAKEMGLSEAAVRQRVSRGLRTLRQQIGRSQ